MHHVDAAVYRVAAGAGDMWNVYRDPDTQPVATFRSKSSALTYAMSLARGKVSWHMLPEGHRGAAADDQPAVLS
jgi:hypothetical protein